MKKSQLKKLIKENLQKSTYKINNTKPIEIFQFYKVKTTFYPDDFDSLEDYQEFISTLQNAYDLEDHLSDYIEPDNNNIFRESPPKIRNI